MNKKVSLLFILLVLVQAAHSVEEYLGKLWEVFPPAVWLTGLISEDRHFAFIVINGGLFVFGLVAWLLFVKKGHPIAVFFIWFWIVIELLNGVVHVGWSIMQGGYTPGVLTAPVLFMVAWLLMKKHIKVKAISL